MKGPVAAPIFFQTPAELRRWFQRHHAQETELMVGFHKVDSGKPSVTWPEAVDEALCFGWIDGVRRSLGAESYMIRFTPRKAKSYWSSVNLKKVEAQIALGKMTLAGMAAYQARDAQGARKYSFESHPQELPPEYRALLEKQPKAAAFHQSLAPGYRKTTEFWVMNSKNESTRLRRLQELIDSAARGEMVRHLTPYSKRKDKAPGSAKPAKPRAKPPVAKAAKPGLKRKGEATRALGSKSKA